MGLSLLAYFFLALTGLWIWRSRELRQHRPPWLRSFHYGMGAIMVGLVLLLLAIGIVGTLGHYGTLGHSLHLPAGLVVVALVLGSAWSATQINLDRPWARPVHLTLNTILFVGFVLVSLTGWDVVQKYLP